ncbi:MAG: exo-alpha-sialidase [Spirochaetia bacterium]
MARLVSLRRIWSRAPHNAFTDLVRFKDRWYCALRESRSHVGDIGRVRIITSADGTDWISAALFSERGVDLRDPKLSVAPGKRLMLLMGGSRYAGGKYTGRNPRVAFSLDGRAWSRPRGILSEGDWLWRVTWQGRQAYGVTYRVVDKDKWTVTLVTSGDGLSYREVCSLRVPGKPNETTLRFQRNGRAIALVRREGGSRKAWIGASRPPYTEWQWHAARHRVGGPNFLVLPTGDLWAAGRGYFPEGPRTLIARMDDHGYTPVLELPSAGDCSYPGLVWHRGHLWVSYYSSHEGKTSVYLARIQLSEEGR